jgi:hypothetical protein
VRLSKSRLISSIDVRPFCSIEPCDSKEELARDVYYLVILEEATHKTVAILAYRGDIL